MQMLRAFMKVEGFETVHIYSDSPLSDVYVKSTFFSFVSKLINGVIKINFDRVPSSVKYLVLDELNNDHEKHISESLEAGYDDNGLINFLSVKFTARVDVIEPNKNRLLYSYNQDITISINKSDKSFMEKPTRVLCEDVFYSATNGDFTSILTNIESLCSKIKKEIDSLSSFTSKENILYIGYSDKETIKHDIIIDGKINNLYYKEFEVKDYLFVMTKYGLFQIGLNLEDEKIISYVRTKFQD